MDTEARRHTGVRHPEFGETLVKYSSDNVAKCPKKSDKIHISKE
jgi:hypothetical protein